jgi:nitrogen-specific signal transduction histidine kinase
MTGLVMSMDKNVRSNLKNDDPSSKNQILLQQIIDAFPQPTALIDQNFQILMVNKKMQNLINNTDISTLIKRRVGDLFICVHSQNNKGCGSSESCEHCGINKSLSISKINNIQQTEDCSLSVVSPDGKFKKFMNLRVTSCPIIFDNNKYLLFTMMDISNDIRRRLLERIFFHDVLNKAGNITGIIDMLSTLKDNKEKFAELFYSLKITSSDLIEEILYQRDLSSAENNELILKPDIVNTLDIINSTKSQIINNEIASNKEVIIDDGTVDLTIKTDGLLLRRVLLNMLKNALEATKRQDKVQIGCKSISNEYVRFWVQNSAVIPKDIQRQLFHKSFSTKEAGRGLGTYSIKLLGEKYLNGKVNFISNPESGTIFMIDLPTGI